jgi:hypothetical protein
MRADEPARVVTFHVFDGASTVPHTLVEVTTRDADSTIGRSELIYTDGNGDMTLRTEASQLTLRVPSISPVSRAFVIGRNGSFDVRPREWAGQRARQIIRRSDAMTPVSTAGVNTITFTVDCWDNAFPVGNGNNCDFCTGTIQPNHVFTYNCNEGTASTFTPDCAFTSPVATTATVTAVDAELIMEDCSGQRAYPSSTYDVLLNGTPIAPAHTTSINNCSCLASPPCLQEHFTSADFPNGYPGFVNGGTNTVTVQISSGAICVEKVLMTLTYRTDFAINKPTDKSVHPFLAPNYNSIAVPFEAIGQVQKGKSNTVNWVAHLTFDESPVTGFVNERSFKNATANTHNETYTGMGGQIIVTASRGNEEATATTYVVGNQIPDNVITAKLDTIYNGPTVNLFTGIAYTESSYRQFSEQTLYNVQDFWPYHTGQYVGLMQVQGTIDRMWDWIANANYAVSFFTGEKASIALAREKFYTSQNKTYPKLRALTALEREDNTLWFYGPCSVYGDRFTPVQNNGTWDWEVNAAHKQACVSGNGYDYVDKVRSNLK